MDSNNQVFYKPLGSNQTPPVESNIASSIISENGTTIPTSPADISPTLTSKNFNNQSDIRDMGNSPPVLRRSERIRKPPPYLKDYSL